MKHKKHCFIFEKRVCIQSALFFRKARPNHGFSSVFFDTPELSKIVLPKILEFCKASLSLGLMVNKDFPRTKLRYVGSSLKLSQKYFLCLQTYGERPTGPPTEFFCTMRLRNFSNQYPLPQFSAEIKRFPSMDGRFRYFGNYVTFRSFEKKTKSKSFTTITGFF